MFLNVKRVILVAKNDAEAADWIGKAREEHDRKMNVSYNIPSDVSLSIYKE